ncbi:unnamed protein product [Eruca vesicaria subsp. sativa]|uniref:BZIP domain-containing protein n=1 Tax=Eruca vesicaria subsp. sativa TaxID=29727 RepID=A0ABC8J7H9_ERUVS|nr:unnamed protein product [Eruca vesicaria subsp. sativa]
MEDGELEFSNHEVFSTSDMNMNVLPPTSCSMDTFFDGLLMDTNAACTHTHTCNPTGPENTHTHTCLHVHTKILPEDSDETAESRGKRPLGNREAVRKYREKKKAKAASLEDEVARLTAVNHQLVKRLQSQAALEAEVSRLKCLLVDLRGRIDGEIGSFPYQKPSFSNMMMNPCNVQCGDGVYCLQEGVSVSEQGLSGCGFDQLQCAADQNLVGNENGSFNSAANVSAASSKRKGGHRAPKAA